MRILVVNDDGINAPGIERLASFAKELGEVTVVAPEEQCSGKSASITIREDIRIRTVKDFPVSGVSAYAISGTPADCVKVGVEFLMEEKPDVVFSGINRGYNAGIEISYSGTVGAAMEGLMKGIPAMAFSVDWPVNYGAVDAFLPGILKELLETPISKGEIWNVNFPACEASQCKGILRDRTLATVEYYPDLYEAVEKGDDYVVIHPNYKQYPGAEETSDLEALVKGYVSIGKIRNVVLGQ